MRKLGETKKTGFETSCTGRTNVMRFYKAEAIAHDGTVLVSTAITKREIEVLEYHLPRKTVDLLETGWTQALQKVLEAFKNQEL